MFSAGRDAALNAFGLKTADANSFFRQGASWLRGQAVGVPGTLRRMKEQAQTGTLTTPGGLYHDSLDWLTPKFDFGNSRQGLLERAARSAGTLASVVAPLGLAYSGYQALTTPSDQRGQAVGGLLGSVAGGVLGGPFGIAGQAAGGALGGAGGAFLGKQIGNAVAPPQESFVSP